MDAWSLGKAPTATQHLRESADDDRGQNRLLFGSLWPAHTEARHGGQSLCNRRETIAVPAQRVPACCVIVPSCRVFANHLATIKCFVWSGWSGHLGGGSLGTSLAPRLGLTRDPKASTSVATSWSLGPMEEDTLRPTSGSINDRCDHRRTLRPESAAEHKLVRIANWTLGLQEAPRSN